MPSQDPPKPSPKVGLDPKFVKRMRDLKKQAREEKEKRSRGDQVKWLKLDDWDGDIFNYEGMHEPFNREQANNEGVSAIADPKAPGTTGDVVAATIQIETLACMERSFRVRMTMRRTRALAHMLARKKGHADTEGVFMNNGVQYVKEIMKQARVPL